MYANIYADQIEYFATHISEREKVCISTHCHNDRGCAVAATELGILAGADRVEGCVFGNGERTGNVDLVTVALNMYTQGVTPNLDFSDITSIVEVSERCNKIPVSPRAPYGGDLVVCAFSGSHQDAIKKGFALQEKKRKNGDHQWKIPYLPLDPKDIGRDYEAVIRVNSQSGKGGAAWIILRSLGLDVPRNMQIDFSSAVQNSADELGRELRAEEITNLFKETYNYNNESHRYITLLNYNVERKDNERRVLTGQVEINDVVVPINGVGNGPVSSIVDALSNLVGFKLSVEHYSEHAIGSGTSTKAASFVQLRYLRDEDNGAAFKWGVGLADDVGDSSVQAILATLNNVIESGEIPVPNVAKKAKASA